MKSSFDYYGSLEKKNDSPKLYSQVSKSSSNSSIKTKDKSDFLEKNQIPVRSLEIKNINDGYFLQIAESNDRGFIFRKIKSLYSDINILKEKHETLSNKYNDLVDNMNDRVYEAILIKAKEVEDQVFILTKNPNSGMVVKSQSDNINEIQIASTFRDYSFDFEKQVTSIKKENEELRKENEELKKKSLEIKNKKKIKQSIKKV